MKKAVVAVLCLVVLAGSFSGPASAHKVDRRTKASWYHAAGLTGACGGTMDHRSAASKWFACGAKVMVVRPNGRHVQVTIDDRCQCGMDLDRSAARKIGISGVGKVAVAKVHPGWRHEGSFAARWIRR
jgi:rare lipoprotein A (peptidoglycan hydrolase)